MTEPLFIVSICVVLAVALALLVWVIVAIVMQNKAKKAPGKIVVVDEQAYVLVPLGTPAAEQSAVAEQTAEEEAPAAEEASAEEDTRAEELAPAQSEEAIDTSDMVVLRRNESIPYAEAYLRLSKAQKGYVDEIIRYAEAKEGVKKVVNDKSASVYLGKKLVVRIVLKRGIVTARLTVQNNDFIAYTDSAGLNIKEKPIDVKIEEPGMVSAVKDIIDITYRDLFAERARREEEKKAMRREQRRLAREKAKAAAAEAKPASEDAAEE